LVEEIAMPDDTRSHSTAEIDAARIVEAFLDASMIPDPVRARTYMAPNVRITFTGGRRFDDPAGTAAFNAARYRIVKKKFERTDVVAGGTDDETIVYNIGTLYGEWPNGETFSGNRYVDRFVVSQGKIVRMDVWNDSAELLLVRAGLAKL
jgi:SnoaL-like protein